MGRHPDRTSLVTLIAPPAILVLAVATVATFAVPAEPALPADEAPTFTLSAHFEGPSSCISGWTLVSAETVWRVPYIPNRGWAAVDATEGELRAAYTRPNGVVDEPALTAAQGRFTELTRVTCRFAPLSRGDAPAD